MVLTFQNYHFKGKHLGCQLQLEKLVPAPKGFEMGILWPTGSDEKTAAQGGGLFLGICLGGMALTPYYPYY